MTQIGKRDVIMWAWSNKSKGACAVAEELGINKMLHHGSDFKLKPNSLIIGWGNGDWPEVWHKDRKGTEAAFINPPPAICCSCNKMAMFEAFEKHDVRTPRWTDSAREAARWKTDVVCRMDLQGQDGSGIIITNAGEALAHARLYVEYIPADAEYRVHVFNGKVIDICKKVFGAGEKPKDARLKVSSNNILFTRDFYISAALRRNIEKVAIGMTKAVGLTFSGNDIITRGDEAFALETNTSPEMTPYAAKLYARAITEYCQAA